MRKIFNLLTFKDLTDYKKTKKVKRDNFSPSGNPASLGKGLKLLDESIVDLNVSTSKYGRILLWLTIILIVLTIVLIIVPFVNNIKTG